MRSDEHKPRRGAGTRGRTTRTYSAPGRSRSSVSTPDRRIACGGSRRTEMNHDRQERTVRDTRDHQPSGNGDTHERIGANPLAYPTGSRGRIPTGYPSRTASHRLPAQQRSPLARRTRAMRARATRVPDSTSLTTHRCPLGHGRTLRRRPLAVADPGAAPGGIPRRAVRRCTGAELSLAVRQQYPLRKTDGPNIAWRVADSLSLRSFLDLELTESAPDHSTLSWTRRLIDVETHDAVFTWVLERLSEAVWSSGRRSASMRRRWKRTRRCEASSGGTRGNRTRFIRRLAEASGVEKPTRAELARFDRSRKNKKTSNKEWKSPQDPDAKIAKMKDGRTHLAHKAEHGVDMDTAPSSRRRCRMHRTATRRRCRRR